jgi:hypothetical protein
MDRVLTYDYGGMWKAIVEIVQDPTSNLVGALLLLAVFSVVVLMVLLVAVMFLLGGEDEDEGEGEEEGQEGERPVESEAVEEEVEEEPEVPAARRFINGFIFWSIALVLMLVVTGVVTSRTALCMSCHQSNPHVSAPSSDPHAAVACIDCHEPADTFGKVTYMVLPRGVHFLTGMYGTRWIKSNYGYTVASAGCIRCHRSGLAGTKTVDKSGVRISHAAPLKAGAECVDCHELKLGMVSNLTVGMSPCLRCHDGTTASADCSLCHVKDIAVAATAVNPPPAITAKDQVPTPDCGGCHNYTRCDKCHGIRLPHTAAFKNGGHARVVVIDWWFYNTDRCSKCHYPGHNSCGNCHGTLPAHGKSWQYYHMYGIPASCSTGCHSANQYLANRNLCTLCHPKGIQPVPQGQKPPSYPKPAQMLIP